VIATAVPWPGSLIAIPLATRMAASPIGPASQLSSRSPHRERIACPISNEAAQMTARDAYAASADTTEARIVDGRSNG
jgi:hypothetical protein